jgi:hypothetical protein
MNDAMSALRRNGPALETQEVPVATAQQLLQGFLQHCRHLLRYASGQYQCHLHSGAPTKWHECNLLNRLETDLLVQVDIQLTELHDQIDWQASGTHRRAIRLCQ